MLTVYVFAILEFLNPRIFIPACRNSMHCTSIRSVYIRLFTNKQPGVCYYTQATDRALFTMTPIWTLYFRQKSRGRTTGSIWAHEFNSDKIDFTGCQWCVCVDISGSRGLDSVSTCKTAKLWVMLIEYLFKTLGVNRMLQVWEGTSKWEPAIIEICIYNNGLLVKVTVVAMPLLCRCYANVLIEKLVWINAHAPLVVTVFKIHRYINLNCSCVHVVNSSQVAPPCRATM